MSNRDTIKRDQFLNAFDHIQGVLPANEIEMGRSVLENIDLPTSRTEAWKYTRLGKIFNANWTAPNQAQQVDVSNYIIPNFDAHVLVFINGIFSLDHSRIADLEAGISMNVLSGDPSTYRAGIIDQQLRSELFVALNTVSSKDGVAINVEKNSTIKKPIHLLHIDTAGGPTSVRHQFNIGESASLKVVTSYHVLPGVQVLSNAVIEVNLAENARMSIDKLQSGSELSFQICREIVNQQSSSHFTINTVSAQGNWIRNDVFAYLRGSGIETHMNGAYMPRNKEHVDNHTVMDHLMPHCESNELYKGIIYDKGTGVFNGKVFVRPDAQKTNAFQQNANILMSDDATMNSKPELEIYADDVKCSHGSTTGQFDEEAVFYLKARGLDEHSAKTMLIDAFLSEVFDAIEEDEVRIHFKNAMLTRVN